MAASERTRELTQRSAAPHGVPYATFLVRWVQRPHRAAIPDDLQRLPMTAQRILVVDLNNFAYYPTIALGYMVASLRGAGYEVEVLSPLAHGVPSALREKRETYVDHWLRRFSYSTRPWIDRPRRALGQVRAKWRARPETRVDDAMRVALRAQPDAVLISTYTDSYPLVERLCEISRASGVPTLVGGPILNQRKVAEEWRSLPGIAGVVGAEVEGTLPTLVADLLAGAPLSTHAGVLLPDGTSGPAAPVLRDVDALPHPDYSDFPWDAYPERIIPILVGRGCGWARCTFCGDIVTANGRGYRARSWPNVIAEMQAQAARYGTQNFTFLDIKLNSNLELWRKLQTELPKHLPDARWIASVHVGPEEQNGLTATEMQAAFAAGLRRVTFGMESASQRLLDAMDKGTQLDRNTEFLRAADEAGISVRCTVMQGYPGEEAEDLRLTAAYLREHGQWLDRVRINRFNVLVGTRFATEYAREPERFPGLVDLQWEYRYARSSYEYLPSRKPEYQAAMRDLFAAVHRINRRPLKEVARAFDGVM